MTRLIPIIAIVLLLLVIAGGVFYLKPQYDTLQGQRADLQRLTTELSQKEEYYSKLAAINDKLEKYKDEIVKIDSALPSEPSVPDLYNYFQRTAPETGLVLKDISGGLGLAAAGNEILEIPISVSLVGSYSSLKYFLDAVYKNSRIFEVKSLKITPPEPKKSDFEFGLTIIAHSYKPK